MTALTCRTQIVVFSRMWSCVCRNVQFCCEYGLCMLYLPPKQKLSIEVDNDIEMRVGMIKELVNVRDGKMTFVWRYVLVGRCPCSD